MKKMKILLVDDEEDFIKALSQRLELRDLKNEIALSGEEALTSVASSVPDVIVLDLKMPKIDGKEVLKRIKAKYPNVQVIILTGHGTDQDEEETKRLGAFEYLKKPVDIDKLIDTIKDAYKKKIEKTFVEAALAEEGLQNGLDK